MSKKFTKALEKLRSRLHGTKIKRHQEASSEGKVVTYLNCQDTAECIIQKIQVQMASKVPTVGLNWTCPCFTKTSHNIKITELILRTG